MRSIVKRVGRWDADADADALVFSTVLSDRISFLNFKKVLMCTKVSLTNLTDHVGSL